MNVPYSERLSFMKYQSAGVCFDMVHDISSFFLQSRLHRREKIHDPLLVALHILYARPFKQRKPLRLEESIIPTEFQGLHEILLTLRDKMHAHTDLDGPEITEGVMMNDLVGFTRAGWTTFSITVANPNSDMHSGIILLTENLKKTTHAAADEIWKRYMRSAKVPDGVAIVNLDPADGPFLVPHPVEQHDDLAKSFVDIQEFRQQ